MFITNIKQGADTYSKYMGRILYAEVRNNEDKIICSATLDFILTDFFDRQSEIQNYKESLMRYINFNNVMIKHVS
jgi:hypothetical protein